MKLSLGFIFTVIMSKACHTIANGQVPIHGSHSFLDEFKDSKKEVRRLSSGNTGDAQTVVSSIAPMQNVTINFPGSELGIEQEVTVQVPLGLELFLPFVSSTPSATPSPSQSPSLSPSQSPSPSSSSSPTPSSSVSSTISLSTSPSVSPSVSPSPFKSQTSLPINSSPESSPPRPSLASTSSPTPFLPATSSPSPSASNPCQPECRCENPGDLLGESTFDESELVNFGAGLASVWQASSWPLPDPPFRSNPSPDLVVYDGSALTLSAEKRLDGLFGAGIRTGSHWYGYGCISACMKPSGVSGVISSLFSFTGYHDGANGNNPNQNEIDIEFEGQDTTVVQFNYYTDKGLSDLSQFNEHDHSLGFDASLSYNVYGFRWTPWGIEWEVNGNIVYTAANSGSPGTPVVTADTIQKVMANIWIVSDSIENSFGGAFDEASFTSTSASYKWIRYSKLDTVGCCTISTTC